VQLPAAPPEQKHTQLRSYVSRGAGSLPRSPHRDRVQSRG
jgi:hypothetical protein